MKIKRKSSIRLSEIFNLSMIIGIYIMLKPIYLKSSGKLQIADFSLLLGVAWVVLKYKGMVSWLLRYKWLSALLVIVAIVGLTLLMKSTKTGLVPKEDMGTIYVNIQASPGSTLRQTYHIMKEVEKRIAPLPQIRMYSLVAGNSVGFDQSSSSGNFTLKLKNWNERQGKDDDVDAITEEIYRRTSDKRGADGHLILIDTNNSSNDFHVSKTIKPRLYDGASLMNNEK